MSDNRTYLPAFELTIVERYVEHETDAAILDRIVDSAMALIAQARSPFQVESPIGWRDRAERKTAMLRHLRRKHGGSHE